MGSDGSAPDVDLLRPRPHVTAEELGLMPPSLTAAEAMPWTRVSRGAFYAMVKSGQIHGCHLGGVIRIPTRAFLSQLGVLDED
jgi:hypothetical protein